MLERSARRNPSWLYKRDEKLTKDGGVDQSLALAGLSSSGSSDSSYACSSWSLKCCCTACRLNLKEGVMRSGEKGSVILQQKPPEHFGQSKVSHAATRRERLIDLQVDPLDKLVPVQTLRLSVHLQILYDGLP